MRRQESQRRKRPPVAYGQRSLPNRRQNENRQQNTPKPRSKSRPPRESTPKSPAKLLLLRYVGLAICLSLSPVCDAARLSADVGCPRQAKSPRKRGRQPTKTAGGKRGKKAPVEVLDAPPVTVDPVDTGRRQSAPQSGNVGKHPGSIAAVWRV